MTAAHFPAARGAYVLLLDLPESARLTIGQLGSFDFPAGTYTYVGSAHGAGGLAGRLKHHLAPSPRPHWHIDHLRAAAAVTGVWWSASELPLEHTWAAVLMSLPGARIIAPRFGASDCRCPSHLLRFEESPDFEAFGARADSVVNCAALRSLPR